MGKKIATITFHACHNYGSMLQAFALQRTLIRMGHRPELLNLRTDLQMDLYDPRKVSKLHGAGVAKTTALSILRHLYRGQVKRRRELFEEFLQTELITTPRARSADELARYDGLYDTYLAGSDQIWNPNLLDFNWAYLLPFVTKGQKISYAASMGCYPQETVTPDQAAKIKEYLGDFSAISVRERSSAVYLNELTGRSVESVVDPVILLTGEEWRDELSKRESRERAEMRVKPKNDTNPYILLYVPHNRRDTYLFAKRLGKRIKMGVVVTFFPLDVIRYGSFVKKFDSGPWDFLRLLDGASAVVTSSFHGTVFSILMGKPFFSVGGMNDSRSSNMLSLTGLENRSFRLEAVDKITRDHLAIDFEQAHTVLDKQRERSIRFLKDAIG